MKIVWQANFQWIDRGPFLSAGYTTPGLFPLPPGFNVYATIALSACGVADEAVGRGYGGGAIAWIVRWKVHNPDGTTTSVEAPDRMGQNAAFIDNCASVTFGVAARGGNGLAQISIFTR